jgi:hypothetical protein
MINVHQIMKTLAVERPVFHSEADFQHALAWELHRQMPEWAMRLEYRPRKILGRRAVDIWTFYNAPGKLDSGLS